MIGHSGKCDHAQGGEDKCVACRVREDEVIELGLCEQDGIYLKPGVLYRFTVQPGCRDCAAIARLVGVER